VPAMREVLLIADGFGLEPATFDVRERVDAETAAYIVDQFGGLGVPAMVRCRPSTPRRRSEPV
jgi:hypothetical protein